MFLKCSHSDRAASAYNEVTMLRVDTHLVMGATGAGKTTLIRGWLAQRPAAEHWAVLMNDLGIAHIDAQAGVTLRQVAGCACCTGQIALRTALVQLLRSARPRRVFIETSAAARPAALLALLNEPGIAPAIHLRPAVCVIDPRQLADATLGTREDYREQITEAAHIVIARRGEDDGRWREALQDAGLPRTGQTLLETTGGVRIEEIL